MNKLSRLILGAALVAGLASIDARAQSYCSSDGVPRPTGLLERFINADCEACWSDSQTAAPRRGELALDWIVPGSRGEDAPLSAAARPEGLARVAALGRKAPLQADAVRRKASPGGRSLRVAHGLALNGYIGASIELKPGSGGPWQAWLLLIETIPAGTDGSPVERNLVRNVLQPAWDQSTALSKESQRRLFELRPMNVPDGAKPERLRVVGWVEDRRGRIVAAAQSRCEER